MVLPAGEITIRKAASHADYRACQEAQRLAWGITEDGYIVPVATMVGAQLHGGLVLGAFRPTGEAVGVSFAFLGRVDDRLCLYSQLTGVVPGHQGAGIGARLKQTQWEFARASGLALLAWAFDPLQAGNARFNLHKLGATADQYLVDMYGPRTDHLNAGVPTDRLLVEWATGESAPRRAVDDWTSLPQAIEVEWVAPGAPLPRAARHDHQAPLVLLEIPGDLSRLRQHDPDAILIWRLAFREAFQHYFSRGYRAVDVIRPDDGGARRHFYVLDNGGAS